MSREHGCQVNREKKHKSTFGGNRGLEEGGWGDLKFITGVTTSEQDSLRRFSELGFDD